MTQSSRPQPSGQVCYEIRVRGHLKEQWAEWFAAARVYNEASGEAVLTVAVPDQAALYGVLLRLQGLCLPLISVSLIPCD